MTETQTRFHIDADNSEGQDVQLTWTEKSDAVNHLNALRSEEYSHISNIRLYLITIETKTKSNQIDVDEFINS